MLEAVEQSRLADSASQLIVMSDLLDAGERSAADRARAAGHLVTLQRGTHVPRSTWQQLSSDEQHRLRCVAAMPLLAPGEVISQFSAALVHGLPLVGTQPTRVTTTVALESKLTSTTTLQRRRVRTVPPWEEVWGLPVVSRARAAFEVATLAPFSHAVATMDALLWRAHQRDGLDAVELARVEFADYLAAVATGAGSARARRVLQFADHRADRPGESLSRAAMHLLGAPVPELQFEIVGVSGRLWKTDFGWPDLGIVGEFDGRAKYSDPRYLAGRSPEQVVYDEKLREDDIRPRVRAFGRWDWHVATSLDLMARKLRSMGVPLASRRAIVPRNRR